MSNLFGPAYQICKKYMDSKPYWIIYFRNYYFDSWTALEIYSTKNKAEKRLEEIKTGDIK